MAKKKDLRYWKKQFEEQKPKMWKVAKDEEFKHCIDKDSFNGKFYDPEKVISNYGRVWLLYSKRFKKNYDKSKDGYYRVDVSAKGKNIQKSGKRTNPDNHMLIHRMVANYFCDKTAVEIYGEKNVEAHHKYSHSFTLPFYESQRGRYKKYWINYYKFIVWTQVDDHEDINKLQKRISSQLEHVKDKLESNPPYPPMWIDTKGLSSKEELSPEELVEVVELAKQVGVSEDEIRIVDKKHHNLEELEHSDNQADMLEDPYKPRIV